MKKSVKYIVLSVLFISFLVILMLVLTNNINVFDNTVYHYITVFKSPKVTSLYKCITFFGSTVFIVILCLLFLLLFWKQKKGYAISVCLIGSTIINNVIKLLVRRERPLDLMMVEENTFSFPSGHTMASVSMYGLLIYLVWKSNYTKKVKITLTVLLSLLILSIAASRIYLGAHFASDIIAAIIMSSIWLIIFISFIEKKKFI